MSEGRTQERDEDAKTARDRALGAIVGADFETQRSLWRAALRYNERMKLAVGSGDYAPDRLSSALGAEPGRTRGV